MKKRYIFFRVDSSAQKGFVFPFLLFLTAVILMAVLYNIKIYQSTIKHSDYHQQNIIKDSLYQMAAVQIKEDIEELEWDNPVILLQYEYPDGKAKIELTKKSDQLVECRFFIETTTGKKTTKYKLLSIP